MAIIHLLSIIHDATITVIQSPISPSLSSTPLAFILNLLNVRVILTAIAYIHFTNSKSLIHLVVILIVLHTPTIWLIVQRVTFPTISFIA